jgi:two-component system, chemotaxis family, chemotaxis protein CheY
MNLKTELLTLKGQGSHLTLAKRAELSCSLAKEFEKTGDYDSAYEALSEFWPEPDKSPNVEGLEAPTRAEILLRAGGLAGWRGGAEAEGDQEIAKDLITRSLTIYEQFGAANRQAEAHGELGLCYWREGGYDEARVQLRTALHLSPDDNDELRAVLLIRAAIVEADSHRFDKALRLYNEALPLIERTQDHALRGSFHVNYGLLLRRLATREDREQYIDRALIEYAAASFHFEQAGNTRALARVEANLGYLFFTIGRYADAHTHLDRAHYLFLDLKDVGNAAKVNDTRARTLLAQGHRAEAERIARAAVRTLQKGGEQANLAEALVTHGLTLARLGNHDRARALFERSIEIAEVAGAREEAGRARLTIIEELGGRIPTRELASIYRSAIELLKGTQDPATGNRLISCAEKLLDVVERLAPQDDLPEGNWEGFSFKKHVRESETSVIERALRDAGGSVTKAAHFLGFKHHQSLISIISTRHQDLLNARSIVRKRRRHLFKPRSRKRAAKRRTQVRPSAVSILHVEDHPMVAKVVGEMLEAANYRVEHCTDGKAALAKLTGDDHYDVLVIDNELPGLNGLELVRTTRKMTHRRRIPIIMLSGDDIEKQAWSAGADEFLRKPEGVERIAATVERVLASER